jgi:hypothetical protein
MQGVVLPNNRTNAARRLSNVRERIDNNEALKEIYFALMVDYVAKGQLEVASLENSTSVLSTASGDEEIEEWEDEVEDSIRRLIPREKRTVYERGP